MKLGWSSRVKHQRGMVNNIIIVLHASIHNYHYYACQRLLFWPGSSFRDSLVSLLSLQVLDVQRIIQRFRGKRDLGHGVCPVWFW